MRVAAYFDNDEPKSAAEIFARARARRLAFYGQPRKNWYVPPEPKAVEPPPEPARPKTAKEMFLEQPVPERSISKIPVGFRSTVFIQRIVARRYGGTRAEMISHNKIDVLIKPRMIAMYLCCEHRSEETVASIARFFERDPTTVSSSYKRLQARILAEPDLAQEVAEIEVEIKAVLA